MQNASMRAQPDILLLDPRHLVVRTIQHASPGEPSRPITWDLRWCGEELDLRADLDRQGDMRTVDFREVRSRLNEVLASVESNRRFIQAYRRCLPQSDQSLRDAIDPNQPLVTYDETDGWRYTKPAFGSCAFQGYPYEFPTLQYATEQMLFRDNQPNSPSYNACARNWARGLDFDAELPMRNPVCRLRILHYWQSRECRELFLSSPPFTAVFATPGLVPELDDLADERWLETATRLARLPRREWMERLGLPPTHQVVRLFSRLRPYLVATKLQVIREVFADPIARRQLSDTICEIPAYLLRFFQHQPLPLDWTLVRPLCRERKIPNLFLGSVMFHIDFFHNEPLFGAKVLEWFRRARSPNAIEDAINTCQWLRHYWNALFQPGTREAVGRSSPPFPGSATIRHLNRPLEIIQISADHNLCLEKFIDPIIRGEYALYRIDLDGHFAVAGIKRDDHGLWHLDDIRGAHNAGAPDEVRAHFLAWLIRETWNQNPVS